MTDKKREPERTSLHPRTFREAVKELVETPPQKRTKKDADRAKDASPG